MPFTLKKFSSLVIKKVLPTKGSQISTFPIIRTYRYIAAYENLALLFMIEKSKKVPSKTFGITKSKDMVLTTKKLKKVLFSMTLMH